MTSLRAALAYASNFLSQIPILSSSSSNYAGGVDVTAYEPLSDAPSCPINGPLSCHNSTPVAGDQSCCFIYPGGRILLTQFWDREVHVGGAEEDWTLHGLWPDLCDGTYNTYCGMSPRFTNITSILSSYNQTDLLDFMDRYWVADRGSNANLWIHEYNKHATCINTLAPSCYQPGYAAGKEVVDYFTRATGLFKMLDTYTALELKGITPHARRHYPLEDVRAILEQFSGGKVVLRCRGRGRDELHEAWYVYFVQGSLQTGQFVPAQDYGAHGDANNCVPWVKYLPKKHK
ncbi:ribonuclease T2 [Cryphonectria parasitica EP155]|uniref:ribonuclease T2 n=1 Tax=Cryphonectria parasitica (strain ATCC 38755 / EP155) TaxID=660469 RepID=A0A9P4YEC9_CRYP1|nr:ribonuclease T2 [Cryphonectria parasitica EP155]KAF3771177.1 ribonuclease T2 [Cryphonectria parasitica EP155]